MLLSIWFFLWGLLWAVYFMLDGFDLGLGTLSPFIAKDQREKNIVHQAIGPFWDGNEVWLIAAGGVTFAAFPTAYAVLFSSFYSPLMIILFALIIRGVSVEFRNKSTDPGWQKLWDVGIFVGSFLPAILFGVAFANIFKGIPIDGNGVFHGSLMDLLNPYGLLGGLLFLCLFLVHGALWLSVKTEGSLRERGFRYAKALWLPSLLVAAGFLIATWFNTSLYLNYIERPLFYAIPSVLIPLAVLGGMAGILYFIRKQHAWYAWTSSAITIVGVTFFGIVGLYPNLLPSSLNAAYNLTIYNAASSPLTLKIMLTVVVIFIPLVIAYQVWVYRLFSHTVTEEETGY
ncbi:MAG: cytochrome d ubiquinol oxidase subunit II [Syntrophobacterales bacterium]|nr:cytochrome d ubiquinol oxidase subunit II [Syntrophobacterales bacterium]